MRIVEIDEYKKIITSVLEKIDIICRENNLKYMIIGGTLLGAMRHGGFIPWDDDIDIAMPRRDYDELAKIIASESKYELNFLRIEDNKDTIFPYGKVCDTNTHVKQNNFKDVEHYGAFVDVFPMYCVPENRKKRAQLQKRMMNKFRVLEHSSKTGYTKSGEMVTDIKRFIAHMMTRPLNTEMLVRRFNQICLSLDKKKSNVYGIPWYMIDVDVDAFEKLSRIRFEDIEVYGPADPDKQLSSFFGDWRKLPPEEERIAKHYLTCYIED